MDASHALPSVMQSLVGAGLILLAVLCLLRLASYVRSFDVLMGLAMVLGVAIIPIRGGHEFAAGGGAILLANTTRKAVTFRMRKKWSGRRILPPSLGRQVAKPR